MAKLEAMTNALGRSGGQTGGVNQSERPAKNAGNGPKPKASGAESLLDQRMRALAKQAARQEDIGESARKDLEEWQKTQKDVNKLQEQSVEGYYSVNNQLKMFGKGLLTGEGNLAGAMGQLSGGLNHNSTLMGKALGGMAAGFGFTLGVLENFAASAKEMGTFADLGAFKVGSVKQAKLMSGLGDSFIKVIADSNGGFKAFGSNSQKATENLSDLARGLRLGSYSINSSLQKALGPEYVKKMNKAAASTAAMGMSQEDQASLMGTLSSTIALTATSEKDAQQKLVNQYEKTVASARTLSNTFGESSKEILKSIENFKKSTSGQAAEMQGVEGAEAILTSLKNSGLTNSQAELERMALLMAKGQHGAAGAYVKGAEQDNYQVVSKATMSAASKEGGLAKTENMTSSMRDLIPQLELISKQRENLGAPGTEDLFDAGVRAGAAAKKMRTQIAAEAGDENAKRELAKGMGTTTEASNIQAMDQLTGALNSLRNVVLVLMTGIVGLTGALGALALGGGLGALMGGGTGLISKLGESLGGVLSKIPGVGAIGEKMGGLASKAGGLMGNLGSGAGSTAGGGMLSKAGGMMGSVGEKAGGMFSKLGGAASSGMSAFGDFLGNLGENKVVKGAGTLALLGGALALAAHGFKTFGEVTWEGMLKGTVALGGLIGIAKLLDKGSNSILKGAGVIAILGASLAISAVGFKVFNEVEWGSLIKGTFAIGGLVVMAKLLDKGSTSILKGAVVIGILGATMWVAGKGFASFNAVDWGSLVKGAVALGVLGVAASLLGGMTASIIMGAAAIAILGASMWVAGKGFASFNEVDWGSVVKGSIALGVLGVAATLLGGMSIPILLGSMAIAALGAAMWVAGQGFKSFNEVDWGSLGKGILALGLFATAAVVLGGLIIPILLGSAAIAVLGVALGAFGLGAMVAAKAAQMFSEAIATVGSVDGMNLVTIGAGLAAIGVGMIAFTAGMLVGTASSVLSGIMGLFGAKSPLERIMEFVPYADSISQVGEGIKAFGEGVLAISGNIATLDTDALGNFKDQMLEFAKAGSSDEMRITAENLSNIGTAIAQLAQAGDIKLPNLGDMSAGATSMAGPNNAGGENAPMVGPEVIEQVLSYLSGMNNDLSAIRSNTKSGGVDAPVRLG